MRQKEISENSIIEFELTFYCWAWGLLLSVVCIPSEMLLEKMNFSFVSGQLEVALGLGLKDYVHFPFSVLGAQPGLVKALCVQPVSGSSYVHQSCCLWKTFLPHCFPASQTLTIVPLHFTNGLESWVEGFDGYIPFSTECYKVSPPLYGDRLWTSVFVSCDRRRKLFWWWLCKMQMCSYNRTLLRVVVFLHVLAEQ